MLLRNVLDQMIHKPLFLVRHIAEGNLVRRLQAKKYICRCVSDDHSFTYWRAAMQKGLKTWLDHSLKSLAGSYPFFQLQQCTANARIESRQREQTSSSL